MSSKTTSLWRSARRCRVQGECAKEGAPCAASWAMEAMRGILVLSGLLLAAVPACAGEGGIDLSSLVSKQATDDRSPPVVLEDSVFVLSPGDKLKLQWWGAGSGEATMVVDTKGSILVPEIGEIDVRNKPFSKVRDTLQSLVMKRLQPRLVSVRILEIQDAMIWLTGLVPNPGPQKVAPGTRLSKAIQLGGVSVADHLRSAMNAPAYRKEDGFSMPSLRRILVIRNGKDTLLADLARAFRSGIGAQDPPLYTGDRVILLPESRHCGLNLGVGTPGGVECRSGDTIRTILQAAGASTLPEVVKVTDVHGRERVAHLGDVVDSETVLIGRDLPPENDRRSVVFVGGRVPRPGAYFFRPGMTIRDLVAASGGVVGGYDSGIVVGIRRGGVTVLPGRRQGLETFPAIAEVAKAYQAYLGTWRGLYSHDDLPLEPEDSVIVKTAQRVVWVGGRVARPGFVPWSKGKGWKHYVSEAGGFTSDAWDSRTQLINPITEQPGSPEGTILPGSALLVPEERYIPPEQWISISISVVSLISSLVTIFILLDSRQ